MDDTDELLTPCAAANDAGRRDQIWLRTRGVLRRRRWAGRARRGLAFSACFAAGALAVAWTIRPEQRVMVEHLATRPLAEPPARHDADPYRGDSPRTVERWAAMAGDDKRPALYRRAGDGYLERGDEVAALRCYRRALENAGPADVVVRPNEDSWMLMSLKFARQKERTDGHN